MSDANRSGRFNSVGYFPAFAYICALLLVTVAGIRIGTSQYYADRIVNCDQDVDSGTTIFFDRENPDVYKSRGIVCAERAEFEDAAVNFKRAAQLREQDYSIWLGYANALSKSGNVAGARTAYLKAISLAPHYAQPQFEFGLMLLDINENKEAFRYLSKAAEHDCALFPELLEIARKKYPLDPVAIESAVNPSNLVTRKATAKYLIQHSFITDSVKGLLTGNDLSDVEKDEFIRLLMDKNQLQTAYMTWLTKSGPALRKPTDEAVIFDGGFEKITESDESGFGWQINQKLSDAAIAIDDRLSHTGSRSLHIRFAGMVEVGRQIISQRVIVKPHRRYELSFAILSSELTSGGLPVVVVSTGGSEASPSLSAPIRTTDNKWLQLSVSFKTNEDSTALISLQRLNCDTTPCPIFGDLSLDDFSMREVGPAN